MAAPTTLDANIRKFEEIGTHPAANHNAIAEAMTFHEGIGAERKAARLRYLRSVWSDRLTQIPGVTIRTSPDPAQSGGLALVLAEEKPVAGRGIVEQTACWWPASCTKISRACASRPTSTRRRERSIFSLVRWKN